VSAPRAPKIRRCPFTGKICYTRERAIIEARKRTRDGHGRLLHYRCEGCMWWHLAHRPKNILNSKRKKRRK
jgi:hypothetical protein